MLKKNYAYICLHTNSKINKILNMQQSKHAIIW